MAAPRRRLFPPAIECAHRIGPYRENEANARLVIIQFIFYKDRELVLSKALAIKGTTFRLSEDFSPDTRGARRALILLPKNQGSEFNLHPYKLFIKHRQYRFDQISNALLPTQTQQPTNRHIRTNLSTSISLLVYQMQGASMLNKMIYILLCIHVHPTLLY